MAPIEGWCSMVMKPNTSFGKLSSLDLWDFTSFRWGKRGQEHWCFRQLIQCLDDRSLSLVMRDAKDDGRKALQILRNHYMGKSKPCVLACALHRTHFTAEGSCWEFYGLCVTRSCIAEIDRWDSHWQSFDCYGVERLTWGYKTFSGIVLQRNKKEDKMKFQEFKVALRSYEEMEKSRTPSQTGDNSRRTYCQRAL